MKPIQIIKKTYRSYYKCKWDRQSSVGIATRFRLGNSRSDSRWAQDISTPIETGPGTVVSKMRQNLPD